MSGRSTKITKRKVDHLKFALSEKVQIGDAGFGKFSFVHNALPEINFDKVDTSTKFAGKKVNYPFFISCMTGGIKEGKKINRNLAKAAQKYNITMGVGSQRAAIEHPKLAKLFEVRKYAQDIPIMANVGLVQLNYGFGLKECEKIVNMIEADALVFHINPIQEVIQPEGDRNFEKLLPKLEKVVKKLSVPIIVKEVGFGLSKDVVERLYNIGVRIFDTAGWGGTNWAMVEGLRGKADKNLGELFKDWGIPTTKSIKMCKQFKDRQSLRFEDQKFKSKNKKGQILIFGSGGIRTGLDIAKAIALGADLAGIATPFAKAALISEKQVGKLIERLALELKVAMFGVGAINLRKLRKTRLVEA